MKEEWRKIPGFPEGLEVSDKGNVRELVYDSEPVYVGSTVSGGYVKISHRGKQYPVHRLVAKAFLDLRDESIVVKHVDGDVTNNEVSNLICVSPEDARASKYKHSKRFRQKVRCIETGKMYATLYSAHAFMLIPKEAIAANADGKTSSCFGFHFEYVGSEEYVDPSKILYKSYLDVVQESEVFDSFESYINNMIGY